jgi:hypothetical protein
MGQWLCRLSASAGSAADSIPSQNHRSASEIPDGVKMQRFFENGFSKNLIDGCSSTVLNEDLEA